MKNHCGESVGLSFRAAVILFMQSETNVMLSFDLLAIFTIKSNDSVNYLFFIVFFFLC